MQNIRAGNKQLTIIADNIAQSSRTLIIRIFGLTVENNENIRLKVIDLFKKININIKDNQIQKCHRVLAKNSRE